MLGSFNIPRAFRGPGNFLFTPNFKAQYLCSNLLNWELMISAAFTEMSLSSFTFKLGKALRFYYLYLLDSLFTCET